MAVEYQLATETPLGKTSKKKKIKRKPAELEPLPVHYLLLIDILTCSQFGSSISGGSILI